MTITITITPAGEVVIALGADELHSVATPPPAVLVEPVEPPKPPKPPTKGRKVTPRKATHREPYKVAELYADIQALLWEPDKIMKTWEIREALGVVAGQEYQAFRNVLASLVEQGWLIRDSGAHGAHIYRRKPGAAEVTATRV